MFGVNTEISSTDSANCKNCGSHLSEQFRRVLGDGDNLAHRCGECDSYRRLHRGSAAGLDVQIPDPETESGRHGGQPALIADGRGQTTTAVVGLMVVAIGLLSAAIFLMAVVSARPADRIVAPVGRVRPRSCSRRGTVRSVARYRSTRVRRSSPTAEST